MALVLVYREDLYVLLLKTEQGLVLPDFEFNSASELENAIQSEIGFFVTSSGISFEDKVIVQRHFGPLNVSVEWMSIPEAE